jgi:hypothetical protein
MSAAPGAACALMAPSFFASGRMKPAHPNGRRHILAFFSKSVQGLASRDYFDDGRYIIGIDTTSTWSKLAAAHR